MYEFAGSKSAKLVVSEYGKLVARILQYIAFLTRVQIYNKSSHVALCFAVFYKLLIFFPVFGHPGLQPKIISDPKHCNKMFAVFLGLSVRSESWTVRFGWRRESPPRSPRPGKYQKHVIAQISDLARAKRNFYRLAPFPLTCSRLLPPSSSLQ
jgi:hypothetical protein